MSYEGDYHGDENRTRRDLAFVQFSAFIETVQKFGCRANDCGSHKFEPALYTETIE
jgi:Uri superfamily endonuclease